LREIQCFNRQQHQHLSVEHLRDWTTVSHAWCTFASAQLVAITVLLVGETYRRGVLPRMPMCVSFLCEHVFGSFFCLLFAVAAVPTHASSNHRATPLAVVPILLTVGTFHYVYVLKAHVVRDLEVHTTA
jgi:hypothetical protein